MSKQPFVTIAESVKPLNLVGEQIRVLADGERTGGYEVFLQGGPDGAGPPPHTHPWDEAYFVLEGTLEVLLGERIQKVAAGEFVFIPGGTPHNFRLIGNTRFLSINSAAGAARFFEEFDREVHGPEDMPNAIAVGGRHRVTFLPPPQ